MIFRPKTSIFAWDSPGIFRVNAPSLEVRLCAVQLAAGPGDGHFLCLGCWLDAARGRLWLADSLW